MTEVNDQTHRQNNTHTDFQDRPPDPGVKEVSNAKEGEQDTAGN